ncbi:hypothetical protein FRC11_011502 [Ceratobasidium sp. 423]|nr:hypothetical protein FRC11_011502 [Ceratobasidium sp. 423]
MSGHTTLLNALNSLDYVPTALEGNTARLQVIYREINSRQQQVQDLERKTKSEYEDVTRAQSTIPKFFRRICQGEEAVNQKLEKEQREYLDAFRVERDARDELAMLMGEKTERERANLDLAKKAKQITELKSKIEELYEELFAGPTPGRITELGHSNEALISFVIYVDYPEEDRAESRLKNAETQYHLTQTSLNKHTTAIPLLMKADKSINTCLNKLEEARSETARLTGEETLKNLSGQLMQSVDLLSSKIAIGEARKLIRQADEACGGSVGAVVGHLDMIPDIPRTREWDGEKFATVVDEQFPAKLDDGLVKLEAARTRLQGEIDKSSARLHGYQNSVQQLLGELQTCQKELADIRLHIMISLTDPAALKAQPGFSAPNADKVGDSDLPRYFDSANTISGEPAVDPNGNISVDIPSYEESQAQVKPVGGFRVSLPNGNAHRDPTPVHAPSGSAPGPGGIGGFRVMVEPSRSPVPSLNLLIPETRWSPMPSPMPSPHLSPLSSRTPIVSLPTTSSQPGPSDSRPISWSRNPYAFAMIHQAGRDNEGPSPPGGWMNDHNPSRAPGEPRKTGH